MSIIRSPRLENNFSVMSNSVIRDSRLSYRARGVLLEILSRPDNWRVSGDSLARTGKEGRDAILTALKELRDCGYIRTVTNRLPNGTFETVNYVYDSPQDVVPSPENPTTVGVEAPRPGKPTPGKPQLDNQGSLEELSKKNLDTNNEFEIFWKIYPRKVAKKSAEVAFAKAAKHTPVAMILTGAGRYARDPNRVEAYTAHPATWLNGHRWLDDALPLREKSVDEKKADELRLSREKSERERLETKRWQEEQEQARANATPMPETLRSVLKGLSRH
jgi:biotin operon repressor